MGTVKSDMRVRIRVKTRWMSLKITLESSKPFGFKYILRYGFIIHAKESIQKVNLV